MSGSRAKRQGMGRPTAERPTTMNSWAKRVLDTALKVPSQYHVVDCDRMSLLVSDMYTKSLFPSKINNI